MGTSANILKSRFEHSHEKLLSDTIIATLRSNLQLHFQNDCEYSKDGEFIYTTANILDKSRDISKRQDGLFYIKAIRQRDLEIEGDEKFDWVEKGKKLYCIGFIEEVYGIEELTFRFMYEYLKINPSDYLWFDSYDWVFTLEDLEKLKKLPYDPEWCYKNPKQTPNI